MVNILRKIKHCEGCGVKLQDENILNIGYTTNLNNDLCMRCFRLRNYGEYESVSSNLVNYEKILSMVNRSRELVLYVVDVVNLPKDIGIIKKYLKNDIILVINKRDLLPWSVKDEKIIEYIKNLDIDFEDIVVISSEKNFNMDILYKKIVKYQKSENVYVVGYTNAGKSSLISRFISNYGDGNTTLTVSPLPSTTLNRIIIPINNKITLIDTPGIIDNSNIINFVDKKMYKKLNSKKEIKPRTYQLSSGQSLVLGDLVRIDYVSGDRNSLTFYIPNEIKIRRTSFRGDKLKDLTEFNYDILYSNDLCIMGLGFIKFVAGCEIRLYINKDVLVFMRNNLI